MYRLAVISQNLGIILRILQNKSFRTSFLNPSCVRFDAEVLQAGSGELHAQQPEGEGTKWRLHPIPSPDRYLERGFQVPGLGDVCGNVHLIKRMDRGKMEAHRDGNASKKHRSSHAYLVRDRVSEHTLAVVVSNFFKFDFSFFVRDMVMTHDMALQYLSTGILDLQSG